MATLTHKRPRSDSDNDEIDTSTIFRTQENFAKFLIIQSTNKDKPITSLSPFVIEKQIESKMISNDQELIQSDPTSCPQNQKGNNSIHKLTAVYENFAKFLIIQSTNKDKPITSLSPFVIEKQIESKMISNDQELIQSDPTSSPQNQKGNNSIHKLTAVYERH